MDKQPQFIKDFSKEKSSEERQETARAIKSKRVEYFAEKKVHFQEKQTTQESVDKAQEQLKEQLEKIENLRKEVKEISDSKFKKLLNYFQLKKLRADIELGEKTYEELKQQLDIHTTNLETANKKLSEFDTPPAFKESEAILNDFYEGQKKQWTESEYSKEDITKYFSEEHLASLSIEDYALLLKRFPSEMVAHVTRQGIRDHIGFAYHTAGEGQYSEGFMKMIEDGRLRSPLGIHLKEKEKEKALAKYLQLDILSKSEAIENLEKLIGESNQLSSGGYADKMAVHFATEEVADYLYGSEKGNEIFVVYPSAYIASQYYFHGQLNESSGGHHNDQWVWANEEKGMDLNAGMVFIPEEAKVDRKTGSRYELDENKNPIKNTEDVISFRKVIDWDGFEDFANQVMEIIGGIPDNWEIDNLEIKYPEIFSKLEPFIQVLVKFGITDKRVQRAVLNYHSLDFCRSKKINIEKEGKDDSYHTIDSRIEAEFQEKGILYKESKDTIDSKEFWEDYFKKNPNKKPSKIIYYRGSDPTKALHEWKKVNGIIKKTNDKSIGFSENDLTEEGSEYVSTHVVGEKTSSVLAGVNRFKTLAEKVIENHYDSVPA